MKELSKNRKAFHDFTILESFEAGIVLKGSEVKALRAGRGNLKDSFCRVIRGELFLLNAHISYLESTNAHFRPDEGATRKLLMHRKQIDKLLGAVSKEGLTIVVLSLYLNDKNRVKARIALASGKNLHDKRESLKRKEADREAQSAMKRYDKHSF